jgi:hypothetical protein
MIHCLYLPCQFYSNFVGNLQKGDTSEFEMESTELYQCTHQLTIFDHVLHSFWLSFPGVCYEKGPSLWGTFYLHMSLDKNTVTWLHTDVRSNVRRETRLLKWKRGFLLRIPIPPLRLGRFYQKRSRECLKDEWEKMGVRRIGETRGGDWLDGLGGV